MLHFFFMQKALFDVLYQALFIKPADCAYRTILLLPNRLKGVQSTRRRSADCRPPPVFRTNLRGMRHLHSPIIVKSPYIRPFSLNLYHPKADILIVYA